LHRDQGHVCTALSHHLFSTPPIVPRETHHQTKNGNSSPQLRPSRGPHGVRATPAPNRTSDHNSNPRHQRHNTSPAPYAYRSKPHHQSSSSIHIHTHLYKTHPSSASNNPPVPPRPMARHLHPHSPQSRRLHHNLSPLRRDP